MGEWKIGKKIIQIKILKQQQQQQQQQRSELMALFASAPDGFVGLA